MNAFCIGTRDSQVHSGQPDNTYRQLYSYELQVVQGVQRGGAGKTLVQCLCDIAREWDMTKVMLTVFKGDEIMLLYCQSCSKK
jgi:hypothetical protein